MPGVSKRRRALLRSSGADRAPGPRITLGICATLKLDLLLRVIESPALFGWEYCRPGKRASISVGNLVSVAISHERIIAAVCLCARHGVTVLVVLETPGDGVIGATSCVCGAS